MHLENGQEGDQRDKNSNRWVKWSKGVNEIYISWCQPMKPLHWLTSTNLMFPLDDLNQFNISIGWKITDSKLNRWFSNQWMVPQCLAPEATLLGCQPRKWFPLVDTSTNLNRWSLTNFKSAKGLPWLAKTEFALDGCIWYILGCSHPSLVFF
jgi:hypothetical protein